MTVPGPGAYEDEGLLTLAAARDSGGAVVAVDEPAIAAAGRDLARLGALHARVWTEAGADRRLADPVPDRRPGGPGHHPARRGGGRSLRTGAPVEPARR
ncbi:hypothetical protein ACN27G_15575 [Plantactinospora sp. WMMB334]|uniref:hypothetical protein n=1 Tax=Plantactinospora sp. WMMB334 TaxID=3404119 RepID=UPI003B961A49